MQRITPCLWFDNNAEEAVNFYISVFSSSGKKNSRITGVARYGEAGPGPKGSVLTIQFKLDGQEFLALNGGPHFKFTEAISLIVNCETQKEIDTMWKKFSQGGQEVQCGWLKDKYGLSWQVVPTVLGKMMQDRDSKKTSRVMRAIFKMKKLNMKILKQAYEQG